MLSFPAALRWRYHALLLGGDSHTEALITAITTNICTALLLISIVVFLIKHCECGSIFRVNLTDTAGLQQMYLNWPATKKFLCLSIPGYQEITTVVAGHLAHPALALSASSIIANLLLLVLMFALATATAATLWVGRYMGSRLSLRWWRTMRSLCR